MLQKSVNGKWLGTLSPLSRYKQIIAMSTFNPSDTDTIELYDFKDSQGTDMPLLCRSRVPEKLSSMAWSTLGCDTEDLKLGVIITGTQRGGVSFWSFNEMIKCRDRSEEKLLNLGCLGVQQLDDEQPIRCLAINSYKPSIFVSGGASVLVHNLEKGFKSPDVFSPAQSTTELSPTTAVGWNYRIPHIFASAAESGSVTVWDLKNKKSIMSLVDPNFNLDAFSTEAIHPRHLSLCWHPDNPTQFAVGCDDDRFSYINIWDLRKDSSPLLVLTGSNTGGIKDISWNPHDSSMILGSSSDKVICWNIRTGEPYGETLVPNASKIQWSSELKTVFSSTSTTGVISIYSHHDAINPNLSCGKKAPVTAPNWLHRNSGVAFGFGGKVLRFGKQQIEIHKIPRESELVNFANDFDHIVDAGNMKKVCELQSEIYNSSQSRMEYKFMQALAENRKEVLLSALGYEPTAIMKEAELYSGKKVSVTHSKVDEVPKVLDSLTKEEADSFFKTLVESEPQKKEKPRSRGSSMMEMGLVEHVSRNMNWNEGVEKIIKHNILIGNLEGAVDCCMKCGRAAEGLILASFAGEDTFNKIKLKRGYKENNKDPYLQGTFSSIIQKNYQQLIDTKTLHEWKEILAYCVTYSEDGGRKLAQELGTDLLQKRNDPDSAIICFIVANAFSAATELWCRKMKQELLNVHHKDHFKIFREYFEKAYVLRLITHSYEPNAFWDTLVLKYSWALCHNREKDLALKYVELGNPNSVEVQRLRERIISSNPKEYSRSHKVGTYPYPMIEVKVQVPNKAKSYGIVPQKEEKKVTPLFETPLSPVEPSAHNFRGPVAPRPIMPVDPNRNIRQAIRTTAPPIVARPTPPPPPNFGKNIFRPVVRNTFEPDPPAVPVPSPATGYNPGPVPPRPVIRPPTFRPNFRPPNRWPAPGREAPNVELPIVEEKVVAPPPVVPPPPAAGSFTRPAVGGRKDILEQANFGIGPLKHEEENLAEGNVEISQISSEYQGIAQYFMQEIAEYSGYEKNTKRLAEIETKMQALYRRLLNNSLESDILTLLNTSIQFALSGNYMNANKLVAEMSTKAWDKNKDWLQAYKRLLQWRQSTQA